MKLKKGVKKALIITIMLTLAISNLFIVNWYNNAVHDKEVAIARAKGLAIRNENWYNDNQAKAKIIQNQKEEIAKLKEELNK